jgi:isoleucyl-tRNA synthetase
VLAASPALVYTADEVWQHHPGLLAECDSVHFAEWNLPEASATGSEEWMFLREVRDTVNAAIEPLRAAGTLATTPEAEVAITAPPAWVARLAPYTAELPSLLLVAGATVTAGAEGASPVVEVKRTSHAKCERCWTYRADVGVDAAQPGLCSRCAPVVSAR